jgi:hypothetical protein
MPPEIPRPARLACAATFALALAGCAAPPAAPPLPAVALPAPVSAAPAPATAPASPPAPAPAVVFEVPSPATAALAHADRVRGLPAAELATEIARLAPLADEAAGQRIAAPLAQVQLALTLVQTRTPADAQRAAQLLQRVLAQGTPEARALHPLARQLAAQLAEHRRLEEQLERQAQQLRDAQRRADQLNARLDALRAMERSRPRPPQ